MFKTGDILNQRYLLKQPLGIFQNGRQTWLAIDRIFFKLVGRS